MKKALIISISVIIVIILSFIIYWNLPIEVTRKSDIKFGNELILKIEDYKKNNRKLPTNHDWQTFEKLVFKKDEAANPVYTSDEKGNFELVYFEGFDGPYLMWSSQERKWTIDFPKIVSK
ncbi:hypothetical protein NZ698_00765 [Chryseobacterium sp. PBS4-4]|uniref:DUF3139 domain-containing protein n=1 Tax=Chryseobacterium edaphi TaxID=2976532 RepID=A0ABT2W1B4_9FLAO|nr:hypothetical protein [Chryseobacterium edaphi]MCU7615713.1 hypothetical protein [Chryseobacterium edaphi]